MNAFLLFFAIYWFSFYSYPHLFNGFQQEGIFFFYKAWAQNNIQSLYFSLSSVNSMSLAMALSCPGFYPYI